ncbi:MAG: hypothetical protein GY898_33205 [Proteobacteria bacterium]|nr:hypothetical protein [Pseudomonadota bacterium]
MLRTVFLGAIISLLPVATAIAWPDPNPDDGFDTADWNSDEYDALWVSLSRAEDDAISINTLLEASDWPLRRLDR